MKEKQCRICGEQYGAYIDFCFRDGEKLDFITTSDNMLDDTLSDNSTFDTDFNEDDDPTDTFQSETTGGVHPQFIVRSVSSLETDDEPTEIDIFNEDQPTIPDMTNAYSFTAPDDTWMSHWKVRLF